MKNNTIIGLGLAMVSVVSMTAAFPVFADVKPVSVETTCTVISIGDNRTESDLYNAGETVVTEQGQGEDKASGKFDPSKSTNLCRLDYDPKTLEEPSPAAKPSDYKDAAIRKMAEEYAAKGYFLTDCKFEATNHSSGCGSTEYVFCNGFTAVDDDNNGNNTCYIEVVKANPEEFKWFMALFDEGSFKVTKNGSVEEYKLKDALQTEIISYNKDDQILKIEIRFNTEAAKNAVG